jgi:hypothetical protein
MSRLTWANFGERFYELGIDRGVLYVDSDAGVAWSGLVSIAETPSGGGAKPFYVDGYKYLNIADSEEFEAKISAFYSPPEFDVCDGITEIQPGLYATQQRRKPFGLSYRTKIGNDIDGENHSYKIHLVFNALAEPTDHTYASLDDKNDAPVLAWSMTTKPVLIPGVGYASHLVINAGEATPYALNQLEEMLYGTDDDPPRLPTGPEVAAMFEDAAPLTVLDAGDNQYIISGSGLAVADIDEYTYQITGDTIVEIDADTYEISSE